MAKRPRITSSVRSVMAKTGSPNGAAISNATTARPSSVDQRIGSRLLAEQAARSHDQYQQHHQGHERQREIRQGAITEDLHEGDEERADQRADEAAHAAA